MLRLPPTTVAPLAALLAAALLLPGLPASAAGQGAGPDTVAAPPDEVIAGLAPGDHLRVTAPMVWEAEGRLTAPVEEALLLTDVPGAEGDTLRIPVEAVQRLWIRAPRTARGAVIGGIAGGLLGGLAGAYVAGGLCETADCTGETFEGAARGAVTVGVAGLGAGALIGSLSRGWERVHP